MNLSTRHGSRRLSRPFGRVLVSPRSRHGNHLDEMDVVDAYRRWAPVYDHTFGRLTTDGRRQAVELINQRPGRVLELGVGTGLSLSMYAPEVEIVGIDLSPDMLERARQKVADEGLENVCGLYEMDAATLDFPDASFDTVVAMYVMTVVPEPEKVMRELARVCKPGGEVLLVNHFSSEEKGMRGWVERQMAPFAHKIGWRPVFDVARVMGCGDLELIEKRGLRPLGLFTMMRFRKAGGEGKAAA